MIDVPYISSLCALMSGAPGRADSRITQADQECLPSPVPAVAVERSQSQF